MLRTQAGLSVPAATRALKCSDAKIRHLETFRNLPSYPDLTALLHLYGATSQLGHFEERRETARKPGWWDKYRLPPTVREYIGLEDGATNIQRFTLELVPGMLQTEAYARAVGPEDGLTPDEENRYVEARLRRGDRLRRGEIALSVVMSQTVLSRAANMGAGGIEQLQRLHTATELPNVTLRVRPFSTGSQWVARGSFTLFNFPAGTLEPIAHLDQAGGDVITEKAATVTSLRSRYTSLLAQALSTEESADLIEQFTRQATGRNSVEHVEEV